jgi:uncharacterized membrane protein YdbT with pleckstrin-like domain
VSDELRVDAVHVDANPVGAIDKTPAAQLELLDGDEIVELSIKPSRWFIAIVSLRFVVVVGALAAILALATRDRPTPFTAYAVFLAVLAVLVRIVVASLQWASRVYVLTNRRVMRLAGVLNVELADCRLTRISGTNLRLGTIPRLFGLGSIHITPAVEQPPPIVWEHVAKAGEIYAKVVRAIKKAQSKP